MKQRVLYFFKCFMKGDGIQVKLNISSLPFQKKNEVEGPNRWSNDRSALTRTRIQAHVSKQYKLEKKVFERKKKKLKDRLEPKMNHDGNFERFFAMASSTAFNCLRSSSLRVAVDFLDPLSAL